MDRRLSCDPKLDNKAVKKGAFQERNPWKYT
jgi:hypothetical protein